MFIGLYFYLLIGLAFGWYIDGKEMKANVPYGDVPSGIPLHMIRGGLYVAAALGWLPCIISAIIKIIRNPEMLDE